MKSLAILLFMMVIRYSSAGYIVTYSDSQKDDRKTFDFFNCFSSNQTILDVLEATAAQMDRLVGYLEKGNGVPNNVFDDYKAAVALERKTVKQYSLDWVKNNGINPACGLNGMGGSLAGQYKGLLEWDSWNNERALYDDYRRLVERHNEFFHTPSATLDKYYAMKQNECYSWQHFYQEGGEDIYDKPTENPFGGESAEAGFECPKKKRESGSAVASKMNAQVLVIFLCMVIGIFVVHLQPWFENGEDELRSKERALVRVQRYFPIEEGFLLGSVEVEVDCNLQSGEE